MGITHDQQGQPKKAEKYFLDAIGIRECLVEKNADAYEPALATSYNSAGVFYHKHGQSSKAEKYYLAAIEIRERLAEKNADVYEPALATLYYNYYLLKKDKIYLDKAYEIAKRRQDNPRCGKLVKDIEFMLK